MTKGKKKKTPSRARYERSHPVVSARVDRQLYDRLQAAKLAEGKSFTDILRIGLGMLEVKVRKEKEIRQEAYEEGQLNGYELAEFEYKVTYPCSKCKRMMEVTTEGEKKAIRKFMVENGWHHGDCSNP